MILATTLFTHAVQAEDTPAAPTPPPDPRKTEAEIASAQAAARKAQAEARKAEQDLYGSLVTAAGTRGATTVNTGAGAVEATARPCS